MSGEIAVVLPALNEADALPAALAGRPAGVRVIVVDNGSTDGTAEVARSLGAEVVVEPQRGFGAACAAGLAATSTPTDQFADAPKVVVFMDADATCDWADLPSLTAPILGGFADLVLGRRIAARRDPGAMPVHVALANRALGYLTGRLAGAPTRDIPPYRAIRRQSLIDLDLRDRTYGWPLEMVLAAGRAGLRITEVPVAYHRRVGTSKVTGSLQGTVRAVARMSAVLWAHRR